MDTYHFPNLPCICGGVSYIKFHSFKRPFEFKVLKCQQCGLARTYPVPSDQQLDKAYCRSPFSDNSEAIAKHRLRAQGTIALVEKYMPQGKTILDIGRAGRYVFEAAGKCGWEAYGIDIGPEAFKHATQKLGQKMHNVLCTDILSTSFPTAMFDIIHMGRVIEHLTKINETLSEINRLLKLNGNFIASMPNHTGLLPQILGEKWYGWAPDQHLWHFSPKVLKFLVGQHLEILELRINEMDHSRPARTLLKTFVKRVLVFTTHIMKRGDNMYIVAKRR